MKHSKILLVAGVALLAAAATSTWADAPVVTIPYQAPAVPAVTGKHAPPVVTIPHDAPRVIAFPRPVPAAITNPQPPVPPAVAVVTQHPPPAPPAEPLPAALGSAALKGAIDAAAAAGARAATAVVTTTNDVAHAQLAATGDAPATVASAAPSPIAAGGSVPVERPAAGTAVPPTGPSAATLAVPTVDLAAERLLDQDAAQEARSKLQAIVRVTGKSAEQEARRQHALQLLRDGQGRQALAEATALSIELGSELSRKYRVAAGEDLRSIAGKPEVYGNADLWPLLLRANELDRPDQVSPGTELDVPLHPSP